MSRTLHYNQTVALDFEEKRHRYTIDGKPITSVTTALNVINKPALVGWASKMASLHWVENYRPNMDEIDLQEMDRAARGAHRRSATRAADIGTLTHLFAEQYARGLDPEIPANPEAANACNLFLQWVDEHEVEFIDTEFKVLSITPGCEYCGTCDLDIVVDGRRAIADIKTSSACFPEFGYQLAAYQMARTAETKDSYDTRLILRFGKTDGEFEVTEYPHYERDWTAFKAALDLSNAMKRKK